VPITGTSHTHSPSSGTGSTLAPVSTFDVASHTEERRADLTERLVAIPADRNLTSAPRPRTWSGLRQLAILVDPDWRHGDGIIAGGRWALGRDMRYCAGGSRRASHTNSLPEFPAIQDNSGLRREARDGEGGSSGKTPAQRIIRAVTSEQFAHRPSATRGEKHVWTSRQDPRSGRRGRRR
jgi:hypothetical protein